MTISKKEREAREALRRAQTPTEIVALLQQGRDDRAAIAAAERIQRRAGDLMLAASMKANPWDRARALGELADWIVTVRADLERAATVRPFRTRRRIPSWVPPEMVPIYAEEARKSGEAAAAALCRKLKQGENR